MSGSKPKGVLRYLLRAPVCLYHWKLGRLLEHRFLLLIHTGRYTGHRHETVLEVVQYRKVLREAVVMSGFGRNSDWLLNIQAKPDFEVIIGASQIQGTVSAARRRRGGASVSRLRKEKSPDPPRRSLCVEQAAGLAIPRFRCRHSQTGVAAAAARLPARCCR